MFITELPLEIFESDIVIPSQRLENKVGSVAKIENVFYENEKFNIMVGNKTGSNTRSALKLGQGDLRTLLNYYNLGEPRNLIGKTVISIYARDFGAVISGLIPVNLDRE